MDYGFGAVVASSFGDIFRNNSSKQGLVTVQLSASDVDELTELVKSDPTRLVVVDVEKLVVEVPEDGWRRSFPLDSMTRERLLEGWDDIGISLRRVEAISTFEATHHSPSLEGVFDADGHAVRA
jgi:3-isopropylmalate/(R)-2-methylmalate dehydratase small subunit